MSECDYCQHCEMCGWREYKEEQGCEFFEDGNRWIPVSERLPEKNVWVLVTVVQGSGWYVETMRIDRYKGMFTDNIDYYDSVIAWMPLPEPYEAESEDTECR